MPEDGASQQEVPAATAPTSAPVSGTPVDLPQINFEPTGNSFTEVRKGFGVVDVGGHAPAPSESDS